MFILATDTTLNECQSDFIPTGCVYIHLFANTLIISALKGDNMSMKWSQLVTLPLSGQKINAVLNSKLMVFAQLYTVYTV